ncbi:MAG: hypothetical protein V4709_11035 [Pseudomonadota bacterium]
MKLQNLLYLLLAAVALVIGLVYLLQPETAPDQSSQTQPATSEVAREGASGSPRQSAVQASAAAAANAPLPVLAPPAEAGLGPRPAVPPGMQTAPGALPPMPTPEPGYVPVMVLDCAAMFPQGDEPRRRCEAGEKQRLIADCKTARVREAEASSEAARQTQQVLVRSVCRQADRYLSGE